MRRSVVKLNVIYTTTYIFIVGNVAMSWANNVKMWYECVWSHWYWITRKSRIHIVLRAFFTLTAGKTCIKQMFISLLQSVLTSINSASCNNICLYDPLGKVEKVTHDYLIISMKLHTHKMKQIAYEFIGSHICYMIYQQSAGKRLVKNKYKSHIIHWVIKIWYKPLLWECNISYQQYRTA